MIENELRTIVDLLKNKCNKISLYSELCDKIQYEDGLFSNSNSVNAKSIFKIYSTRLKINEGNTDIVGLKETLSNIENYLDNDLLIYTLAFDDFSYTLFITLKKDEILGVIRSKYLNKNRLSDLNKEYLDREFQNSTFKIHKGKIG